MSRKRPEPSIPPIVRRHMESIKRRYGVDQVEETVRPAASEEASGAATPTIFGSNKKRLSRD